MSSTGVDCFDTTAEDAMLLPQFITDFCSSNPEQLFARVIDTEHDSSLDGTRITARQLLLDSRLTADHLRFSTGLRGGTPMNISILARSGYDFLVNFIGICLNHWTPVLISTRNSQDAIIELVRTSSSQCLVVDEPHALIGDSVLKQIEAIKVARLYTPIPDSWTTPGEQDTFMVSPGIMSKVSADDPALFMHSSGTTGHPKLIPIPHRVLIRRLRRLAEVNYVDRPALAPVPFYHTMGVLAVLGLPMVGGLFALIMESNKPITGEVMVRMMSKYPGAVSLMAPATLLDMLRVGEDAIRELAKAHRVMFAGASLPREVGNRLASNGVKLMTLFGTTETGGIAHSDLPSDDPNDWEYFKFRESPDIVLVPVDGSKDLVLVHVKEGEFLPPALIDPQDPYGYTSGDIFEQHPSKKGLWRHAGRKSSVTVLSNGEKTDNGQLENLLLRDPLISMAVVFGSGRFQNGVLLLPNSDTSVNQGDFIDSIWETVEHANTIIPQHSRLVRPLVLVADASKGFCLTDKRTMRRAATLELYKDEIEHAYNTLETNFSGPISPLPHLNDEAAVLQYVRDAVVEVMKKRIDDGEDLFDRGMDSLSALTLRSSLLQIIRATRPNSIVPHNIIYHYPTIAHLTEYIGSRRSIPNENGFDPIARKMNRLVETFTADFSNRIATHNAAPTNGLTILLTGSTGTFGSQILAILVQNPYIAKIVCLNRRHPASDILQRHRSQMDNPGLLDAFRNKLEFLTMEISKDGLGLDNETLEMIRCSVTDIIHCAWDINFNHPLDHFVGTHVAGVKHLAQIALSSKRQTPTRFTFISSIASVGNYHGDSVPEQIFDDPTLPFEQGYGQSKFVAELLLNQISAKTGLPVSIIRVGQLSGSTVTGHWNSNEYVFSLLQSSIAIGKIPDWLPDVRWLPTNVAAEALVDILLAESNSRLVAPKANVYHLESPAITRGSDLVRWAVELSGGALAPVPSTQWLDAVSTSPSRSASVKTAERLYDFFRIWLDTNLPSSRKVALSIENSAKLSAALANCSGISQELFSKYYGYAVQSL